MESDVNATLSELERKLKELERELETVGRGGELDSDPAQGGWTPPADLDAGPATPDPGPPPAGATPFTAVWRGGGEVGAPPASPYPGAPPAVPVSRPPAPWPSAPPAAAPPPFTPAPPPAYAAPPPPPVAPPPAATSPLHEQLDELRAFRDRLVQTTDDLVAELSRVLTDLGVGAPPDPADTVLSGPVTVVAAPFRDLASLAAFEHALLRVPGVSGAYVRSLDAGRAEIDLHLAGPVALGATLRATAPVAFAVTDVRDGRLTLSIG